MNGKELQAARKVLMLDVREAAELIGGVSKRSWQYWEAGRSKVPDDVGRKMAELLKRRQTLLEEAEAWARAGHGGQVPYYASFHDFDNAHPGDGILAWRIGQSVAAELHARLGVALV